MATPITSGPKDDRDRLHSEALRGFHVLVHSLGGDAESLIGEIRAAEPQDNPGQSFSGFVALLSLAAQSLNTPDFGLRLAERQHELQGVSPLGVAMRHAPTIGQALTYCASHSQAYSAATQLVCEQDSDSGMIRVTLDLSLDHRVDRRQAVEHGLLLAARNLNALSQGHVGPRRVSLRHAAASGRDTCAKAFGCPVDFHAPFDGLWLLREDLARPVVGADPLIFEMACYFIDNRFAAAPVSLSEQISQVLIRLLPLREVSIERVAQELRIGTRSLQRQLKRADLSFAVLRDQVRRDLASDYIRSPDLSLAQMSERLGYAEPAVLARSLKRWFGTNLNDLRQISVTNPK